MAVGPFSPSGWAETRKIMLRGQETVVTYTGRWGWFNVFIVFLILCSGFVIALVFRRLRRQ
jgi:hypothetical protein